MESVEPVAEISALLDELASLIQRAERACVKGTPAQVWDQIRAHEATVRRIMEHLGAAINAFLATRPPADLAAQTHASVTSRVRAWSSTSPTYYHIFNTPRQELDPYEVTDLLLDKRPGGADVAAQMLDNFYLNMITSAAFRLRSELLVQELANVIRSLAQEQQPVRLLNLHTGSGRELHTLSQDPALRAIMHVTCLDTDASALRRVKQTIGAQLGDRIHCLLADPRRLMRSGEWPDAPYDIIYAFVLFDQLSDRQVERLIAACYRGLRPGDKLLFGNYASSMPSSEQMIINWVMNWNIRRRSEEMLRQLCARTTFGAEAVSCELDRFGASWLVTVQRS